jgi:hypothetical protein
LDALAEDLRADDRPFLDSATGDRAASVREQAEAMLARLPGTPQAARRLQDALSRIKVSRSGLLRGGDLLRIEFPATVPEASRIDWAMSTLGGVGLDDFARALGRSAEAIVAAAVDDEVLLKVVAVQAARARRYDLVTPLVQGDPATGWSTIAWAGAGIGDAAAGQALAAAAIRPELWREMPDHLVLDGVYRALRAPLPEASARGLLAAPAWRAWLDDMRERQSPIAAEWLATAVTLMPAPLRAALRADLAPLDPHLTARALAALTLLDLIESA